MNIYNTHVKLIVLFDKSGDKYKLDYNITKEKFAKIIKLWKIEKSSILNKPIEKIFAFKIL